MAFNSKSTNTAYHVKLTNQGRQLLSQGLLNFRSFSVGDSEVDYTSTEESGGNYEALRVLRPVDSTPNFKYPVGPRSGASPLVPLLDVVSEQLTVRNAAPSRGPFTTVAAGAEINLRAELPVGNVTTFVKARCLVSFDGTDVVALDTALTVGQAALGDWLLVHVINPYWVASAPNSGDRYAFTPTKPGAYLLYRIRGAAGSQLTLDRPGPRFTGGQASPAFVLPGGNAIEEVYGLANPVLDWDEDQLGFVPAPPVASSEVGLWNCNIIYSETVIGGNNFPFATYPSNTYAGARGYLGYPVEGGAIALLHYSNHVVHNLYGEALTAATVEVNLPSVMWWGTVSGQGGLRCKTSTTRKQTSGGAADHHLIYHDLQTPEGRAVGRVYPALKVITLDDPELVAALSAKSNRNWTLPPFEILSVGGSNLEVLGGSSESLVSTRKVLHVTYAFANGESEPWQASQGYGLRNALPCQYVSTAHVALADVQYLEFKFSSAQLVHLQDATTTSAAAGGGYTAARLYILFQETLETAQPAADAWVALDVTAAVKPPVTSGAMLLRASLGGLTRVDGAQLRTAQTAAAAGSSFYVLPNTGTLGQGLTFGEETVLLGNVKASIEALAFRTSFLLTLPEGEFATSNNPTWQPGQAVAITELGIYDGTGQMVATAKLTDPLRKAAQTTLNLDVQLDF